VLTDNRICVAFGDDDVDHTVDAARRAFAAVAWIGVVAGFSGCDQWSSRARSSGDQ
jgi:hypothetical protein